MKTVMIAVATFFNVGKIPLAPGTWASLITTGILFLLHPRLSSVPVEILALLFITLLGIPAAGYAEKHFQKKDPGECVIDEVAGQMICLIFLPHSVGVYLAAFLVFRFFDILKPFPIRQLEKIGGGLGIMADDLLAGLYTLAVIHLFIWLQPMIF
jgi:phosphatidylglycerophosphatase A